LKSFNVNFLGVNDIIDIFNEGVRRQKGEVEVVFAEDAVEVL
jgi:hypothetical protein